MKKYASRRVIVATVAALGVATGGVVAPTVFAAENNGASECAGIVEQNVDAAEFEWAIRDSWNNYIYGPISSGKATFTGDVKQIPGENRSATSYDFLNGSGTVNGDVVEIEIDGSVHFEGHDYGEGAILDNEFSNFRLVLDGTSAVLYADMHYREFIDTKTVGPWITKTNTALGEWTLSAPVEVVEGEVDFASAGNGKFATEDAIDSFAGFYTSPDNDRIAPIAGSFTVSEECEVEEVPTEGPEETEEPSATEEPSETEDPEETSTEETTEPTETSTSKTSTKKPTSTKKTTSTTSPSESEEPTATEEPTETEEPWVSGILKNIIQAIQNILNALGLGGLFTTVSDALGSSK